MIKVKTTKDSMIFTDANNIVKSTFCRNPAKDHRGRCLYPDGYYSYVWKDKVNKVTYQNNKAYLKYTEMYQQWSQQTKQDNKRYYQMDGWAIAIVKITCEYAHHADCSVVQVIHDPAKVLRVDRIHKDQLFTFGQFGLGCCKMQYKKDLLKRQQTLLDEINKLANAFDALQHITHDNRCFYNEGGRCYYGEPKRERDGRSTIKCQENCSNRCGNPRAIKTKKELIKHFLENALE